MAVGNDDEIVHIAQSMVYLKPLAYLLDIQENAPFIDFMGGQIGHLQVKLSFESINGNPVERFSSETPREEGGDNKQHWNGVDFEKFANQNMQLKLEVIKATGISSPVVAGTLQIRYKINPNIQTDCPDKTMVLAPVSSDESCINPEFGHTQRFTVEASKDLQQLFQSELIQFELWGKPSDSKDSTKTGEASNQAEEALKKVTDLSAQNDKLKKELEEMKNKKSQTCVLL
uniref:Uncharacterized protein n=1 Tax=Mucochytrium quahogii TaxID=96639 RepID=A0A7S2RQB4_9STRA|mmetsp:Transcript_8189/g.13233  ORF Transcript_8189/g.13233 Transcript_8189/m.13233 type:complete len:230 (-) Transcript_8189:172-861(-)